MSPDPAGQYANPYAYGPGNPVKGTDPDGRLFMEVWTAFVVAVMICDAVSDDCHDALVDAGEWLTGETNTSSVGVKCTGYGCNVQANGAESNPNYETKTPAQMDREAGEATSKGIDESLDRFNDVDNLVQQIDYQTDGPARRRYQECLETDPNKYHFTPEVGEDINILTTTLTPMIPSIVMPMASVGGAVVAPRVPTPRVNMPPTGAAAEIPAANQATGFVTQSGTKVNGFTSHGVDRVVGDTRSRAGTRPQAILDALRNPTKVVRGVDNKGRPYEIYTGRNGRVVVRPRDR